MQGEFQFYNGVCGVITLKFITPHGEIYIKNMIIRVYQK
ncbi:hypothetical protein BACI71_70079 [Bacillus mycoides]|uniref:Uncharacterized protein n=1 Tax=Bacillus mycoides TaxID=1405 RepID=A0A654B149_BACMY|nr:hypothetical protein BACI71_70079 [Bacillus mycoides]